MKYIGFNISVRSFTRDEIINDWLKKNPNIKIVQVAQSQNENTILISIFYEE